MTTEVDKPERSLTPPTPISAGELRDVVRRGRVLCLAGGPIDGDSLASAIALRRVLCSMGLAADVACADPVPESLHFLPDVELVTRQPDFLTYASVIVLDCGELKLTGFTEQLSKLIRSTTRDFATVVNVDHHLQDPGFGHRSHMDRTAASTGLIVHELSRAWSVPLDAETATALIATLYYDTGSFQHANTDARALRMAADCVKAGADAGLVAAKLYRSKTTKALRLWGRALERTELHPNSGMALSVITQQDFTELNVTADDTSGIVSFLAHVPECRFALLLTEEEPGYVKGSLRSNEHKDTDVASIAKVMGGGGHRLASGFKVPGRIRYRDGRYQVV